MLVGDDWSNSCRDIKGNIYTSRAPCQDFKFLWFVKWSALPINSSRFIQIQATHTASQYIKVSMHHRPPRASTGAGCRFRGFSATIVWLSVQCKSTLAMCSWTPRLGTCRWAGDRPRQKFTRHWAFRIPCITDIIKLVANPWKHTMFPLCFHGIFCIALLQCLCNIDRNQIAHVVTSATHLGNYYA